MPTGKTVINLADKIISEQYRMGRGGNGLP